MDTFSVLFSNTGISQCRTERVAYITVDYQEASKIKGFISNTPGKLPLFHTTLTMAKHISNNMTEAMHSS